MNINFKSVLNNVLSTEIQNFWQEESQKDVAHKLLIKSTVGSYFNFFTFHCFQKSKNHVLLVLGNQESAAYALNELENWLGKQKVLFFPDSSKYPYEQENTNNANVVLRTKSLEQVQTSQAKRLIVTYPKAISELVVSYKELINKSLTVKVKTKIDVNFLNELLFEYDFNRVDFVTQPGEFAVRGGIVDIFSYAYKHPVRITFFDDEVEAIKSFDVDNQMSNKNLDEVRIVPNFEDSQSTQQKISLLEYLPKETLVISKNLKSIEATLQKQFDLATNAYKDLPKTTVQRSPNQLYLQTQIWREQLQERQVIEFAQESYFNDCKEIKCNQSPQPPFNKKFDLLVEHLNEQHKKGYINYLVCNNEVQQKRLEDIFKDIGIPVHFQSTIGNVHEGFINHSQKIGIYTDHQIFERYHKFDLRNSFTKKEAITLKELNTLQIGDYVTHIDHGIGKFAGLKKIKNLDKEQEAIKLLYQNNDILYVSIHSLHKITKFRSKNGSLPKINKLGSPAWKNLKKKTKKKLKEIAFDLIQLYAKRQTQKGFQFAPDSYLQNELEASFIYEDTPDQMRATADVKQDMESEKSMDRLICGDVGFGKTEVAIRAAFKAATDGKQVAVLVPTTILAFQHHKSFTDRLKDFPVRVEYLNRFKTAKEKKTILEGLENGTIDIVIGTHQLVGKNVKYKDLGLLIVDEEHKFGVGVKDKLKTIRANIDTLTLTATPIPRTLQFSLMAARDLSIIKTPPPNRQAIHTQLIGLNENQIRDAVFYETQRGGQVFVIHNRIQTLQEVAGMIQRLVPSAKIATGHGQMEGKKLEDILLSFMQGKFDVLVSTTIVESGLDVSNANTIIIMDAHNFGLADLHQMRGRVGRSNKKAFCYLVTPPLSSLTNEAKKRLQAIEQFSDLGSGFNIAMKDLEIRGAGNLLGAEQSGFISDIGFDTYQKILNETIEELKEKEFKELFAEEKRADFVNDVQIDTDLELLLPDDYVNNVEERLALYNELASIEDQNELLAFHEQLVDRFGQPPRQVIDLLKSLQIKWLCKDLGIERLVLKQQKMLAYFNQKEQFYQTNTFSQILTVLQQNPGLAQLKEKTSKENGDKVLLLVFKGVGGINQAKELLKLLWQES